MAYLLDTPQLFDVLNKPPEDHPLREIVRYANKRRQLYLSTVSLGFIAGVAAKMGDEMEALTRLTLFTAKIGGDSHILPLDMSVAWRWGKTVRETVAYNESIPTEELMVAATAALNGYTLITTEGPWHSAIKGLSRHNVPRYEGPMLGGGNWSLSQF